MQKVGAASVLRPSFLLLGLVCVVVLFVMMGPHLRSIEAEDAVSPAVTDDVAASSSDANQPDMPGALPEDEMEREDLQEEKDLNMDVQDMSPEKMDREDMQEQEDLNMGEEQMLNPEPMQEAPKKDDGPYPW